VQLLTTVCAAQAVNGGSPTYFNIPLPFDLTTLLAIVRLRSCRCHILLLPLCFVSSRSG